MMRWSSAIATWLLLALPGTVEIRKSFEDEGPALVSLQFHWPE